MFGDVIDMLFGCWHRNYSFPITAKKGGAPQCEAARVTGTYVVCLDCGKEFPYDWSHMKVLTESETAAWAKTAPVAAESTARLVKAA
jgi:RNA polymerase subunit RPABC4/transcription elongation factor Spt4